MRRAGILLLAALAARAGDDVDALLRGLKDPDAQRRRAAQAWLMDSADLPWERVVPLLDARELEVRRAVRDRIQRELRGGARAARLAILRALEEVDAARGLLPVLASMARKADPEIAGRAMIAHMRIGGHRDYVADLAASRGTWVYLREFDPERDEALRAAVRWYADTDSAAAVKEYLDLLAAASPEATAYLAERISEAKGRMLRAWVEMAAHHAILPAAIGPVLADRLRTGPPGHVATIAGSLVAGDPLWGEAAAPVREAALERAERDEGEIRLYLLLLLARCGADDPRVRALLVRDAARDDAVGIAAACLLQAHGASAEGGDPVARLAALEPLPRLRVLARMVELGTAEVIPLIRDRLLHGEAHEQRIVFGELKRIRARHLLLPDLKTVMESEQPWHLEIAVRAAAQVDPLLESRTAEGVLLAGLAHPLPRVRAAALYACDDLWRFGRRLPPAIEKLMASPELSKGRVGVALTTMLGRVGERGRHALGFLPLLARIVRLGPPDHILDYKSAHTVRYECLRGAIEIDARAAETRAACRAALGSNSTSLKLKALYGFLQVERPGPDDRAAVASALDDTDPQVKAYAQRIMQRGGWREN